MSSSLIIPMFCHVTLAGFLYAILTIMRAPAVWNIGANADGSNPFIELEKSVSANLSNQFEWPVFFYVACLIVMFDEQLFSEAHLWLAWLFIIGRILHSLIHIMTNNIRLRGIVFTINFLAVVSMWVLLLIDYIRL